MIEEGYAKRPGQKHDDQLIFAYDYPLVANKGSRDSVGTENHWVGHKKLVFLFTLLILCKAISEPIMVHRPHESQSDCEKLFNLQVPF